MKDLSKEEICSFVDKSIKDRQYNDELLFLLPSKTIKRVKEILHLDLNDYKGVIASHSVRHIHKNHSHDISYICDIIDMLQKFSKVQKSITRDAKTGASLVSLEFYKEYDNHIVKLVKLRVYREKRLALKTLFIKG
jgi:hypothetical protein